MVSFERCNQTVCWGCILTPRLSWGRNPFQGHMLVGEFSTVWPIGLRASVSFAGYWLDSACSFCHGGLHNIRMGKGGSLSKRDVIVLSMYLPKLHPVTVFTFRSLETSCRLHVQQKKVWRARCRSHAAILGLFTTGAKVQKRNSFFFFLSNWLDLSLSVMGKH